MKRSGTTTVFVLVWAIMLVGAYGLGVCVREYRFRRAGVEPQTVAAVQEPSTQVAPERVAKAPMSAPVAGTPEAGPSPGEGPGFGGDRMTGMRQRFENMSEEERQQAMSRMRDRFGSRRQGEGMPQLSDEDREKMRAEIEDLRARWESMSEEERQQAQDQMREKYGFAPRGFGSGGPGGGGFGGDRSSGSSEGGRSSSEESSGGQEGTPPPKGRTCFVADTHVWVGGKLVQISKVAAGQTVGNQFYGSSSIERVQEHEGTFECRDIALESGDTIGVVDAHCFMLDSGQWIAAENLKSGLRLKTQTGSVSIKNVTKRAVPYTGKVYNLKVKNSDQYMVGKDAIIVRDY
ncbi:MAG: hypothetical protein AAB403_21620 [Planctomycetota bacterium]